MHRSLNNYTKQQQQQRNLAAKHNKRKSIISLQHVCVDSPLCFHCNSTLNTIHLQQHYHSILSMASRPHSPCHTTLLHVFVSLPSPARILFRLRKHHAQVSIRPFRSVLFCIYGSFCCINHFFHVFVPLGFVHSVSAMITLLLLLLQQLLLLLVSIPCSWLRVILFFYVIAVGFRVTLSHVPKAGASSSTHTVTTAPTNLATTASPTSTTTTSSNTTNNNNNNNNSN